MLRLQSAPGCANRLQNKGMIVMARAGDGASNVQSGFASSNYPNPALRPQLVVNYRFARQVNDPLGGWHDAFIAKLSYNLPPTFRNLSLQHVRLQSS